MKHRDMRFVQRRDGKGKDPFDWRAWVDRREHLSIRLDKIGETSTEIQFHATENRRSCWVYLDLGGRSHHCSCGDEFQGSISWFPLTERGICRHILSAAFQSGLEALLIPSL